MSFVPSTPQGGGVPLQPGLSPKMTQSERLDKMRSKLATSSQPKVISGAERWLASMKQVIRQNAKGVMMGTLFLALGGALSLALVQNQPKGKASLPASKVSSLSLPKQGMTADEKSLFYAYALYDFAALKALYPMAMGHHTLIDPNKAQAELHLALAQASEATRFKVAALQGADRIPFRMVSQTRVMHP